MSGAVSNHVTDDAMFFMEQLSRSPKDLQKLHLDYVSLGLTPLAAMFVSVYVQMCVERGNVWRGWNVVDVRTRLLAEIGKGRASQVSIVRVFTPHRRSRSLKELREAVELCMRLRLFEPQGEALAPLECLVRSYNA